MAADRLAEYRLTPAALGDLEDIWLYSARTWSVTQADRYVDALERTFDTLLAMPRMARERTEIDPPVRLHPSGQHVIVYRIEVDHLTVLRILGGRQHWQAVLDMED